MRQRRRWCTLYQACGYLSMLGLKLNHVSKRGHRGQSGASVWISWVTSSCSLTCLDRSDNDMGYGSYDQLHWPWGNWGNQDSREEGTSTKSSHPYYIHSTFEDPGARSRHPRQGQETMAHSILKEAIPTRAQDTSPWWQDPHLIMTKHIIVGAVTKTIYWQW